MVSFVTEADRVLPHICRALDDVPNLSAASLIGAGLLLASRGIDTLDERAQAEVTSVFVDALRGKPNCLSEIIKRIPKVGALASDTPPP